MSDDLIHAVADDGPTVGELLALLPDEPSERRAAFANEARAWVGPGISVAMWYPAADGQAAAFTFGAAAPADRIAELTAWLRVHPAVVRVGTFADIFGADE